MSFLNGKKTYIVAAATLIYAGVSWWAGSIDQVTAVSMIAGALGLGSLRHGISNASL